VSKPFCKTLKLQSRSCVAFELLSKPRYAAIYNSSSIDENIFSTGWS